MTELKRIVLLLTLLITVKNIEPESHAAILNNVGNKIVLFSSTLQHVVRFLRYRKTSNW